MDTLLEEAFAGLLILGLIIVGFLPTILAFSEDHPGRWRIAAANFLLGAIGIGWIVAWVLYFSGKSTSGGLEPTSENSLRCEACDRFYDPTDYRVDAVEIFCSYCGEQLPAVDPSHTKISQ